MRLHWLRRLILPGLGLLIAEIILRLAGYPLWHNLGAGPAAPEYEGDSLCGWRLREGVFDLSAFDRTVRMTNWPGGMRSTRSARTYDHSPTVLLLGDSYVAGYGLSDRETFAWLLQERHPELNVLNLGTPGYGTVQSYLAMNRFLNESGSVRERHLRIFYFFNRFHETRNIGEPAWYRVRKEPPARYHFPFMGFARDGQLKFLDTAGLTPWRLSTYLSTVALLNEVVDVSQAQKRLVKARGVTEQVLLRMQSSAASHQAKFEVVFLMFDPQGFSEYGSFMADQAIPFADCRLKELQDPEYLLPDGHPNAAGNKLIADCLEKALTSPN